MERVLAGTLKWARRTVIGFGMASIALSGSAFSGDDRVERALSLLSQEKYAEARAAIEPLLRRTPDAPRVRLVHGILRAREGAAHEAIAVFERLRNDRPDMFEPYNNLAVLYAEQGRLDEAREVLLAALVRKRDAVAYANLGDVYTRLADRAYSRARYAGMEARAAPRPHGAGEAPSPAAGEPAERSAPERPAKPAAAVCVRAGKFNDRKAAIKAVEWMYSRGAEAIDVDRRERRIVKNYRVYLPGLPSARAADEKLAELRGRGIRDVAVMRKGARAGEISLGVFKSESNTRRRVAALEKLGYSARWAANAKTVSEYVVRARSGETQSAMSSAWKSAFPDRPIEFVDCP